jgi:signal transduction histidine kinase
MLGCLVVRRESEVRCPSCEAVRPGGSSSRWSRGVLYKGDADREGAAYAQQVDASGVRRIGARSQAMDWLLVASLLLLVWFEIWVEPIFQTGMPGPRVPLTLLATLAVVPLLARRVYPLAALSVMCAAMVAVGIVGDPEQSTFVLGIGLFIGTYSLGACATARHAIIGAGVVIAATIVFDSLTFVDKTLVDVFVPMLLFAAAFFGGTQVQRQRQRAGELAEHAAVLERNHELEMRAAVADERTRIARELHDVVAHAISVMGIQAGAARRTLAPGQDAQQEALLDVERLGREALDEMQRMLGVLRTGDDRQGIGPLPGLADVQTLAADARRTGLKVALDVAPDLDGLPAGVQLTAYRIIQEALTNVRRHAHASRVDIALRRCDHHLEVTIIDNGNGTEGDPIVGNGLIGMRERAALHHGTLSAGTGDDHGFTVRARLPVQAGA